MTNLHARRIRGPYSSGASTALGRVASLVTPWDPSMVTRVVPLRPRARPEWSNVYEHDLPHVAQPQATHWPPRGPARVLMVFDRPVLIELIRLTLNHGVYTTRAVTTAIDAANALSEWQPHLAMLDIDILKRTVRAGTSELHLTSLEQSLLYVLAANAGRLVTREEILDTLWGVDYVAESNIVDRQIRNLRARLEDDWRQPRFIATVPGRGYRFIPTFTDSAEAARAS